MIVLYKNAKSTALTEDPRQAAVVAHELGLSLSPMGTHEIVDKTGLAWRVTADKPADVLTFMVELAVLKVNSWKAPNWPPIGLLDVSPNRMSYWQAIDVATLPALGYVQLGYCRAYVRGAPGSRMLNGLLFSPYEEIGTLELRAAVDAATAGASLRARQSWTQIGVPEKKRIPTGITVDHEGDIALAKPYGPRMGLPLLRAAWRNASFEAAVGFNVDTAIAVATPTVHHGIPAIDYAVLYHRI